jgi:uncharacterized membrane protein YgcG
MKRKLLLFLVCVLLLALPCLAADYADDLWRLNDFVGLLTEEEQYALEDIAYYAVEELQFDFPICITDNIQDTPIDEFADWFYAHNGFGYDEDRDGVLLLVDSTTGEALVRGYGPRGEEIFGSDNGSLREIVEDQLSDSPYDAIYDYITLAVDTVQMIAGRDLPAAPMPTYELPVQTRDLPDWYPEDVASFQDFHDPDAPRVVDNADIFSDQEERALTQQLSALREKYNADFVLLTDDNTYDFSHDAYAADYYIFNGYGVGQNSTGMILFICMEPGYRGFWYGGTGDCENLFTGKNNNRLEDQLYDYMVDGNYAAGVEQYFNNVDKLFATGRVPRTSGENVKLLGISGIIGAVIGFIVLTVLRSGMKTVAVASSADSYLAPGSFQLTHSQDIFLHRSVSRTLRESSSRSSGGGGKTSSSSGHSFSGGGRRF